MATSPRHRIQRQVLDLRITSRRQAIACQNALASSFRDGRIPGLDRLFDRYAGTDEILRIERLEVDLGDIGGDDWQQSFNHRLLEVLDQVLSRAAPGASSAADPADASRLGQDESRFRMLLHFLELGRLPWWGSRPDPRWPRGEVERLNTERRRILMDLVRGDERARLRLIRHTQDRDLDLLAELGGIPGSARVLWLATSDGAVLDSLRTRWREGFWMLVLTRGSEQGLPAPEGVRLLDRVLGLHRSLSAQKPDPSIAEERFESHGSASPAGTERDARRRIDSPDDESGAAVDWRLPWLAALPDPWRRWSERLMEQARREGAARPEPPRGRAGTPGPTGAESGPTPPPPEPRAPRGMERAAGSDRNGIGAEPGSAPAAPGVDMNGDPDSESGLAHRNSPGTQERQGPEAGFKAADGGDLDTDRQAAVYLSGAGLIILHPFLAELFRERGLLRENEFRDEPARERAVCLLGLLAFGEPAVPEYDLLLAKLLCAMPWQRPLAPCEPEMEDRAACDALLHAVLGHWKALKSASPQWLREQFILREGKLEKVDDGRLLTIERRAQDVLLDKLPWGLGLIRLPWMNEYLHVSWSD